MTIEQAKEKLKRIEGKKDPLLSAFYGGRVGFRKHSKRYAQEIDRTVKEACEAVKLREFIEREENKLKPQPVKPAPYFQDVADIIPGRTYRDCIFGPVLIVRKNKNTVTIQTESGYKETRKPHFIFKE